MDIKIKTHIPTTIVVNQIKIMFGMKGHRSFHTSTARQLLTMLNNFLFHVKFALGSTYSQIITEKEKYIDTFQPVLKK